MKNFGLALAVSLVVFAGLTPSSASDVTDASRSNEIRDYCGERYPLARAHNSGSVRTLVRPVAPRYFNAPTGGTASSSNARSSLAGNIVPRPKGLGGVGRPRHPRREQEMFAGANANKVVDTRDQPVSTFGADVDRASYSHVRRWIRSGNLPPPDAVRPEELINAFQYDYETPGTIAEGFRPMTAVHPSPWAEDRHLLHIGIKAFDSVPEERPSANLVLLLDVSGSMAGAEKLGLVRQAMCVLIHGLSENDQVSIVTYAAGVSVLLPPTPAIEKELVLAALDDLTAGGGTAGEDGLSLAYATARLHAKPGYISRVILATDGDFNIGPANPRDLNAVIKRQAADGIGLSVLGFGQGNTRDDIMQSLAQNGNGMAAHIDTMAEAMRVLSRQLTGTLFTVAKDVKFQVEFNPARVTSYRLIGYETRALDEADFVDNAKDAGDVGAGHVVTALYEITIDGLDASPFPKRRFAPENVTDDGKGAELAFVKIRFKPFGQEDSTELSRVITNKDLSARSLELSTDIRFAAAVAWFAQKLRGEALANSNWSDIAALARGAIGRDTFGERAKFLDLIHRAAKLDPAE